MNGDPVTPLPEDQRDWPDSVWLWHNGTTLVVSLEKPQNPDGQRIRAVQYGRFLDRASLEKLASAEDGIDVGRYVNNLLRIVHNQQRELKRLHERIDNLHELVRT